LKDELLCRGKVLVRTSDGYTIRQCRHSARNSFTGYCWNHRDQYEEERWASGEEAYAEHTAVY
jgi:hypothetical protein